MNSDYYLNISSSSASDDSRDTIISGFSASTDQDVISHTIRLECENTGSKDKPVGTTPGGAVAPFKTPDIERIPPQEWRKLSHGQRRNILKKRRRALASTSDAQTSNPERKRERETETTPSPSAEKKRPKLDYSAATRDIRVAVTHRDYPIQKMEEKSMQGLTQRILEEIFVASPAEGEVGFNGYTLRDGALVVNCLDQLTHSWFTAFIARLSQWEGIPLKVCDPKELESYVRTSMFIPKPIAGGIENCIKLIGIQNRDLQVNRWKILGNKEYENGIFLVVSIPESIYKILEGKGMKVKHGLHTIQVKPRPTKEESTKKEEGPKEKNQEGKAVLDAVAQEEGVGSVADLPQEEARGSRPVSTEVDPRLCPDGGLVVSGVGKEAVPALSSHVTVPGVKAGETSLKPRDPASIQ